MEKKLSRLEQKKILGVLYNIENILEPLAEDTDEQLDIARIFDELEAIIRNATVGGAGSSGSASQNSSQTVNINGVNVVVPPGMSAAQLRKQLQGMFSGASSSGSGSSGSGSGYSSGCGGGYRSGGSGC